MAAPDAIERSIVINASRERIWTIVTEPGWFIGDHVGDKTGQTRTRDDRGDILVDPRYGTFLFRTIESDPMRRLVVDATYLEKQSDDVNFDTGSTTRIEFRLDDAKGGIRVTVAESGFAALGGSEEELRQRMEGNIEGWDLGLGFLKRRAEEA